MDAGAWSEISFMRTVKPSLICPSLLLWSGTTTLVHHFSWIVKDRENGFQCRILSSFLMISDTTGRNTRSDCHMQWPYIGVKGRHWIVLLLIWERERELLDWLLSRYQEFDTFTSGCHTMLIRTAVQSQRIEEFSATKGRRVEVDRASQEYSTWGSSFLLIDTT